MTNIASVSIIPNPVVSNLASIKIITDPVVSLY